MTVLVTGDLHWSDNIRDSYRHAFVKRLRNLIRKHEVELVIILGDLTEVKDNHGAELVNQIVDHIYQLSQLCPVIVNMGNHDYKGDPNNPFFAFLQRLDGVEWIGVPTPGAELTNASSPASELLSKAVFLPHTPNHVRDWKDLKFSQDWIFAHNTFAGADAGRGQKLAGIEPPFPEKSRVISGDVHIPQQLGNITYVGSPYTIDFGDDFDPRVLLITGHGVRLKSIPVGGPQKRLIDVQSPTELAKQKHVNEGDIVKVQMHILASEYAYWSETKAKIRAWCEARGYVVHLIKPIISGKGAPARKLKQEAPKSDEQLLTAYGKSRRIDKQTMQTGHRLQKEAP